jgi:hypothetical protein
MNTPDFSPSSRLTGDLIRRQRSSSEEQAANGQKRESRLRGTLVQSVGQVALPPVARPTSSRVRMSGGLQAERGIKAGPHAPTWELKFGNHGTAYGNLKTDGFEARNSNHSSGQDAFAVSADRRRFAVADGLGGATDKEGTAFLARYIADAAVQHGIDIFFNADSMAALYSHAENEFAAHSGRGFIRPRIRSRLAGTVATTLTYAEALDSGQTRIVTIGDSPAFLTDEHYRPVTQYGEDAQSGAPDSPLAFKLGIDMQGGLLLPAHDDTVDGKRIVDTVVGVPAGHAIVIGTDYFSDIVTTGGRFGELSDFVGKTPEQFHEITQATGKPDDATLVAIRPEHLFT